jgi:hypothetical protein
LNLSIHGDKQNRRIEGGRGERKWREGSGHRGRGERKWKEGSGM